MLSPVGLPNFAPCNKGHFFVDNENECGTINSLSSKSTSVRPLTHASALLTEGLRPGAAVSGFFVGITDHRPKLAVTKVGLRTQPKPITGTVRQASDDTIRHCARAVG